MIKSNLLLVVLASTFAFAGCKKDEKPADTAAKTAETAAAGDTTATAEQPASEEKAAPAADETAPAADETAPAADETAPAAADGDMNREEVAEKAVSMFTKMNEIVKAGNGDCAKIAAEFTTLIVEFKPVMEAGKKFEEDPANKQWFEDTYGEKVQGIMAEMMGGMGACMTDPAIQKAFEGMED